MPLQIAFYGDPVLRKKAKPVERLDEETLQLIAEMKQTLLKINAIGMGAPQVHLLLRILLARFPVEREYEPGEEVEWQEPRVFINPLLSDPDPEILSLQEGSFSFPGVYVEVPRPKAITVEAMDETGRQFKERLQGYPARIVMHENDYLNGVLMIDRIPPKVRKEVEPLLQKLKMESRT